MPEMASSILPRATLYTVTNSANRVKKDELARGLALVDD